MKEQVKSKYRRRMHPKNIFGHQAININGLFAHNPDTEETNTPSAQQLLITLLHSTQFIGVFKKNIYIYTNTHIYRHTQTYIQEQSHTARQERFGVSKITD